MTIGNWNFQHVRDTIIILEDMLQSDQFMLELLYPKEYKGICDALDILYDVEDSTGDERESYENQTYNRRQGN